MAAYTPAAIKFYLIGKGLNPADAEKFSNLPWVSSIANGEIKLPPGLPELSGESVAAFKKQAKDAGVPLTEFAQQKLAPSTIQTAAAGPPAQAGVAAAAQAAADIQQPIAPTPQMAGGAPSPLGPLPPGTSIMAPPPGMLPSSSTEPFGMEQPQPIGAPNDMPVSMAGFAPATPQGGGGMAPMEFFKSLGYGQKDVEKFSSLPYAQELVDGIYKTSSELGIHPRDLGAAIGYETANTFDPWKKGPTTKWGEHRGLIQWGEPQRGDYDVSKDMSVADQMEAVTKYLKNAGVEPGMGRLDIYSGINAGHVGKPGASDRPGKTVASHVAEMNRMSPAATPGEIAEFQQTGGTDPYANAFANVELADAGVASTAWPNAPASAPTLAAPPPPDTWAAPPPPQTFGEPAAAPPSAQDLSTDWTPPQFAQGDFGPPTPQPPVLGGGVGYDTRPPSADPSMLQRPLEPQLGPLVPPVLGAPVLGSMGGGLASNEDALGPLLDPSMPLPTRNPGAPAPLSDPNMPLPTRAPAPPLPPPAMTFDPRATPTMTPPPQISSLAANPPPLPSDIAQPTLPPPMADLSMPLPLRNPGAPPAPMGVEQSPPTMFDGSLPGTSTVDDMGYPPSVPNFSGGYDQPPMVGGAPSPFSTGGPPGTTPSVTDPNTYLPSSLQTQSSINQPPMSPFDPATAPPLGAPTPFPSNAPGLNVSGTTGFPQPSFSTAGFPIAPQMFAGTPSIPAPPPAPNMLSPGLPTPSEGFSPTAGPTGSSPMVGDVPVMPSWAMPGAFGMPGAGSGNIGGISPAGYAGGTSVPTSMAASTGAYMDSGFNPATTLGQSDNGAGSPGALGAIGGMFGPEGAFGPGAGGNLVKPPPGTWGGVSYTKSGAPASNPNMEAHAIALMQAQHVADMANAYQNLAPRMVGAPVRSTVSGSSMLGLTGRPNIMQSELLRPYGMNVGFNGPSFGSRF